MNFFLPCAQPAAPAPKPPQPRATLICRARSAEKPLIRRCFSSPLPHSLFPLVEATSLLMAE
jgi:hypothetical protein